MWQVSSNNEIFASLALGCFLAVGGGIGLFSAGFPGGDNAWAASSIDVPSISRRASLQKESLPIRILLGIFSMNTEGDFERRKVIRDTYLSYYKSPHHKHGAENLTSSFLNRICSLNDLQTGTLETPEDCQLVYTFVVGAANSSNHSDAPTQLLDDSRPMLVDRTLIPNSEDDVTYLNIRENMNEGKSLTWFKHASSNIAKELRFDFVSKVDTDTLLYPENILATIEQRLRYSHKTPRPNRVYGGVKVGLIWRGYRYMQGGFYFLSTELASFITSKECSNRSQIIAEDVTRFGQRTEDAEIGLLVASYPGRIQWLDFQVPGLAWFHHQIMKGEQGFDQNWENFLAQEEAHILFKELRKQHNGCPPEEVVMKALGQVVNHRARKMILGLATKC
jgi:hypothetical protein